MRRVITQMIGHAAAASGDGPDDSFLAFAPLKGDRIFLLDIKEVTRASYGYWTSGEGGSGRIKKGSLSWWWLRSPEYEQYDHYVAGCVDKDGDVPSVYVKSDKAGISPAFNVDLSSVIFASEISSEPGSYTLTLKDNKLSISITGGISRNGKTVTVPYSVTGKHNRVSVLMTDKAWTESGAVIKYYGELNGSKQFTLPDDYNANWKVYILAEKVNGEKETDYASIPVEIFSQSLAEPDPLTITDAGERDEAGSTFYPLCARQKKVKKNSITFTWNRVKGATSYVVYGYRCETHKSRKLTTTTRTSYTWKKLKKGTVKQHRRLSYESTNPAVATVSSKGKIKAVGRGTCYVYAYTQNGLFKRVKVTVKK